MLRSDDDRRRRGGSVREGEKERRGSREDGHTHAGRPDRTSRRLAGLHRGDRARKEGHSRSLTAQATVALAASPGAGPVGGVTRTMTAVGKVLVGRPCAVVTVRNLVSVTAVMHRRRPGGGFVTPNPMGARGMARGRSGLRIRLMISVLIPGQARSLMRGMAALAAKAAGMDEAREHENLEQQGQAHGTETTDGRTHGRGR